MCQTQLLLSRPSGRLFFQNTWHFELSSANAQTLPNSRKTLSHSSGDFANFRVFYNEVSLIFCASMSGTRMLGNGRSVINITISYTNSYRGSNGREATVTERAARSNPQRAVGEAHCELYVTQKVIDAHLKALSTPWWTESSIIIMYNN